MRYIPPLSFRTIPAARSLGSFTSRASRWAAVLVCFCLAIFAVELRAAPTDQEQADENAKRFAGGAPLRTNPNHDRALRLADAYAADKHYDFACELWQKVLNESGDALVSRDGQIYYSLAEQVERSLSQLPPEALRAYRVSADGEALAILAAHPDDREHALGEIVRRYFLSNHGDDAAYELGCLALDRYDFVGASRLFDRVLHQHPDPSPPRGELLLRYALANSRLGDQATAERALADLAKASGRPEREALAAVQNSLRQAPPVAPAEHEDWRSLHGSPSGVGAMPAIPARAMQSELTELWGFSFPMDPASIEPGKVYRGGFDDANTHAQTAREGEHFVFIAGSLTARIGGVRPPMEMAAIPSEDLVQRWKSNRWRPVDQLLFAEQAVFFKTQNDLASFPSTGSAREPLWRSGLRNHNGPANLPAMLPPSTSGSGWNRPQAPAEVLYFGDQVRSEMSLVDHVIYSIEGRSWRRSSPEHPSQGPEGRPSFAPQMSAVRARTNWLTAYDLDKDGYARWSRPAGDPDAGDRRVGFLAAPTPYGKLLLAPVIDEESLWVYALNQTDGRTVWKSYLCDQPAEGSWIWNRAPLVVEGRDAYVAAGGGVVFSLDAASGAVRMAVRYERSKRPSEESTGFLQLSGFDEDALIAAGRGLIVVASDHSEVFCIDRNTGATIWSSPQRLINYAVDYCIGVHQGVLYLGGRNVIRAINATSGAALWERELPDSFGRAALTADAIYAPLEAEIVKLSLDRGETIAQVQVNLIDDEPLGNLYSDGEKLWGVGATRVYALTSLEHRLALLEKSIRNGDPHALLERMRLHLQADKSKEAFADLTRAFDQMNERQNREAAAATMIRELSAQNMPSRHPVESLVFLQLAAIDPASQQPYELSEPTHRLARDALSAAMHELRSRPRPGSIRPLSALLALQTQSHELQLASQTLLANVKESDAPLLKPLLAEEGQAAAVIEAYSKAQGAASKPLLLQMLTEAGNEHVRLSAARALANLGDRGALTPLLELLSAEHPLVRSQAYSALRRFTGENLAFDPFAGEFERIVTVAAWKKWIEGPGATAPLHFPLPLVEPQLNRTLVALYGENLVVEFDAQGKKRWERAVQNPWACQGLPNGHRLIACYAQNLILEFDEKGNEVWRKEGLPGNPFSVQRLNNGNTLVACSNAEVVVEIARDGSIAWQASIVGRPMDARRLDDGSTIVALANAGKVVMLDRKGKVLKEISNLAGPISAQPLANGRLLIAQMTSMQVVEKDWSGAVSWTRTIPSQPYCAQKTSEGTVLICGDSGAYELSGEKTIWNLGKNNVSGVSRF